MIYLDSSVALAHIFSEDRRPPDSLWFEDLVSSRLLEFEIWCRVHPRAEEHYRDDARALLTQVAQVPLADPVLARALDPFPVPLRTLDALHLSTALFLAGTGKKIQLATYGERMLAAAKALEIPAVELG